MGAIATCRNAFVCGDSFQMLFPELAESRPAIQPRQYQLDAFAAVKTYLEYRDGNPCVVLPTGAGKTILIVLICQWVVSWGGRVLILAHVRELLQQAADKLNAMSPELHVGVYSAGLGRRDSHEVENPCEQGQAPGSKAG